MGDDEVATVRAITEYRAVIAAAVAGHGGRVVDAPGDNVLAEFASVVDAVQGAVDIQRKLQSRNADLPVSRRMRFRIGINLGDVIVEGDRLYGDGVNIAARLESLAEGGGICLSGTAYDQVEGKLPFGYEFMGEHTVKNIARPVRVYRVHLEPGASRQSVPRPRSAGRRRMTSIAGAIVLAVLLGAGVWAGWRWLRPGESAGLPLPDRPSVAVLPFSNLSQDPTQEYFSDGVTEDLITGLSKVSGLFVIARNSAFTYKGRPVKVREVGRDLGVRYVLEGGVRRAGSRVRITAQLVDATTGYHIWAERYDREVRDIFAVQDEVTQQIVRALAVKLTEAEKTRIGRAPTGVLEAYDLGLRGKEARYRTTREGNAEARRLFVKALDLDPGYALAYAGLGWTHLQSWQFLWTTDRESLGRARELAERAIALDNTLANAYEALAEILGWSGRPEESIRSIQQAMRLNPHYPFFYLWTLGHAYYLTERRQEALDTFGSIVRQNPNFLPAYAYRAVVLSELGREKDARNAWQTASHLSAGVSMPNLRERLPYRRAADLDRFLTGAHRVGMQ